jgi:hypothetical protein
MSRAKPKKRYDRSKAMKQRWAKRKLEARRREAVKKQRSIEKQKLYAAQCVANTEIWDRYARKFGGIYVGTLKPWMFEAMTGALASGVDNPRLIKGPKTKPAQVSDDIWRELLDRPPRPYHTPSTQHVVRPL